MDRKDFLKKLGMGLVMVPVAEACNVHDVDNSVTVCSVMPAEEEGPYPYPGGESLNPLNRSDIKDGQTGIPVTLNFLVMNVSNKCKAVPNASIHIWHCNKDGYFSGYADQAGANGTQSFVGDTWLRGFQLTDGSGVATFKTIYPGWIAGRSTHIHMEVYVNATLVKTTQLAAADSVSSQVYKSPLYVAHGDNPTTMDKDPVFSGPPEYLAKELMPLTGDLTSGYQASMIIGVAF